MGSCLSKKSTCGPSSSSSSIAHPNPPERGESDPQLKKNRAEQETVKKEIFIIKHRKSHDRCLHRDEEGKRDVETGRESGEKCCNWSGNSGAGNGVETTVGCRLSRSSSTGKAAVFCESGGTKYSVSKRSFDFETEGSCAAVDGHECDGAVSRGSESRCHSHRMRQPSGRRRTPSRERERRVSISPNRRSESPVPTGGTNSAMAVKRIQVKRNAGGNVAVASRTASSPRTRSPARMKASNENQDANPGQLQQPLSLSRTNSRKAEISPYRRNPLGEIDANIILQTPLRKQNADTNQIVQGEAENKMKTSNSTNSTCKTKNKTPVNVINFATESLNRSSRLSRELDIDPETLSSPVASSYNSLLLEDIQNFHQKNTPLSFSLPPCVTKARSIVEAVADLNSTSTSNLSNTISEDRRRNPMMDQFSRSIETNKPISREDPLMESKVVVNNDLVDPTFHKYVTVGRGGIVGVDELQEQESSGSNSFVGTQQNWTYPSSWEPKSVDSTKRLASSRSVKRQHEVRHVVSDSGRGINDSGIGTSSKKRV